jgi:hypothetical protein
MDASNNMVYNVGSVPGGTHNIVGNDPMFVDYDPLRVEDQLVNNDFRLTSLSTAIDRGTAVGFDYDLDGNPRFYGSSCDIGAYEFQGSSHMTTKIRRYLLQSADDRSVPVQWRGIWC